MINKKRLLIPLSVISILMFMTASFPDAEAHASWTIPPPSSVHNFENKKLSVVIGETDEPAFTDEMANLEIIIRDVNTRLPVPNAFRNFNAQNAQSLWVDAYFYAKGTPPGLNNHAHCGTTVKQSPSDSSYGCAPTGNHIAKTGQNVRNQFGKTGYYQAADQWYTKTGLTLYHLYGMINYYNDVMIPVDIWTDGQSIKLGTNGEISNIIGGGGFGLHDRTAIFWPPNSEQPENMRQALADNWNFLEALRVGINQIISSLVGGGTPIPEQPPLQ
jgi:hypothetical protein